MSALMRLLAIAVLSAIPVVAQAQRTFALVIGIDKYSYVPQLDGARNDAIDLTQALQKGGAAEVVTLLDREVTKSSVTAAWQQLLQKAERGDVIFLTYAGHGAQVAERNKGEEADHLDEFWVLTGFNPKDVKSTWRETVFDNELATWVADAASRGVRVVLVSDSCHAGGMDRAVTGKVRYVDLGRNRVLGELFAAMLQGSGAAGKKTGQEMAGPTLPAGVTLLAATPEALPVPEVAIDGKARGALSWSVARAIEGMADRDGDGLITRLELEDYVTATVRIRSEALQTPVFTPVAARSTDEPVFPVKEDEQMKVASNLSGQSGNRPQPVARALGFKPVLTVQVIGSNIRPVDTVSGDHAYRWDVPKSVFLTPNGEVGAANVGEDNVDGVVSKFILLDFLKALAQSHPGEIKITPQKPLYLEGDRIKFEGTRGRYNNMLAFNLANTGEIQFLDMIVDGQAADRPFLQEMQVVAPYGADHLITIASDQPLETIGRALQRGVSAKDLLQILSTRIDGTDSAIAIQAIYTRHK